MKAVGARIKEARKAAHMTQETLAEKIGVSITHMSVIERGVKSPRLETFITIANVLGVSADALLYDVVDKATKETANELSDKLSALSAQKRRQALRILGVLLEEE